jgi:hypothetical protein
MQKAFLNFPHFVYFVVHKKAATPQREIAAVVAMIIS